MVRCAILVQKQAFNPPPPCPDQRPANTDQACILPRTVPIATPSVRATAGTSRRKDVAVHYHTAAQWVFPGTPVEAVSKQMMVQRD